jgi:hypothetical protein
MFQYTPDDPYKVHIVHKGPGGVENFKNLLNDTEISYILLRLSIIEYSAVAKCVLITWVGENVDNFHKARSSGHRLNLYEFARGNISLGGEYQPQTLDELTDEKLVAKITGGKSEQGEAVPAEKVEANSRFDRVQLIQPKAPEIKKDALYDAAQKEVEFSGKEEIKNALLELVDPNNNLDFVKFEVGGKTFRDITYIDKGTGSLTDEWRQQHLNPTGIYIFVLSISTSEGGYGMVKKYVFIQWIGAQVKHINKSRANEVRFSLYKYVDSVLHMSGELQSCQLPEVVTRIKVLEKVSGTRVRGKEMQLEKRDDKFTGLGKDKMVDPKFANEEDIDRALEEIVERAPKDDAEQQDEEQPEEQEDDNKERIRWFGVKYQDNSIDVLVLDKKGKGDIEEFKQELKPDGVYFIVFKIYHAFGYAKDLIYLTYKLENILKPYYGILQWQGNKISLLEKSLSSHAFNWFQNRIKKKMDKLKISLQGSAYHAEYLDEVLEERIKKIMRLYD